MNKLLKSFKHIKIHSDEEFKFSTYPEISPYSYVISNYGRVFSYMKDKEKKYHFDKDGYVMVSVQKNKGKKRKNSIIGVHRLVAWEYCIHYENKNLVNHIDGVKNNNFYKNLEWCTPSENTRHAIMNGLQINSGVNCPSAVYSETIIRDICSKLESGKDVYYIYKSYYPNSKVADHREFYQEIFSIRDGTRHLEISSQYDISKDDTVSKVKERFTTDDTRHIIKHMLNGKTNIEILRTFGFKSKRESNKSRRYYDKICSIRKKYKAQQRSTTNEH